MLVGFPPPTGGRNPVTVSRCGGSVEQTLDDLAGRQLVRLGDEPVHTAVGNRLRNRLVHGVEQRGVPLLTPTAEPDTS